MPGPSRPRPAFFVPSAAIAAWLILLIASCSPRLNWREIRQPGYVVALPDRPQTVQREIAFELPAGQVRAEMTMLSTGVGASLFAVGSVTLPPLALDDPAALDRTLAWFSDGLLRNVRAGGPHGAEAPAPAGLGARKLHAARAFVAAGQAGGGRPAQLAVRLYVVDDRLYQLVALAAEGELPPQAMETFFDSFRLTP